MFYKATTNIGYNSGHDIKLNPVSYGALGCVSNTLAEELGVYNGKHFNEIQKAAKADIDFYPLSLLSISEEGSTGSDEYHSGCELMSCESRRELEFSNNITDYCRFDENEFVHALAFGRTADRHLIPTESLWKKSFDGMRFCDGYSSTEFPDEVSSINSMDKWNPPTSLIYHFPQSPNHKIFPDKQTFFSDPVAFKEVGVKAFEDERSRKSCEKVELKSNALEDGCYLFAMADNAEELRSTLRQRGLMIEDARETGIPGHLVVVFSTHEMAKQAFVRQKEIGVLLIPQSTTRRYWYKNPTPEFHVVYETNRRVTVKSGKSLSNTIVGDFLMKNSRSCRGCIIWADQMKGYRLRVVGFVGKFVRKDGRVIIRNESPSAAKRQVIGWISTLCIVTKTKFVSRLSGNQIEDYLYSRPIEALE
jgi:hypothetical protein